MQKDNVSAEEEMRKLQEDVMQKEREHLFLSDEVAKHKMAAEMAAELQGLQAGGERRCSNVSQTGDCCLEEMLQEVLALGTNGVETLFQRVHRVRRAMGGLREQMPGGEEGRKDSENEHEQGRTSQQLALSASGGFSEGTSASNMELDLPRVRGAHDGCGDAGNSGTAQDRKRSLSNSQSRLPIEEDASLADL